MKEALVKKTDSGLEVSLHDVPVPKPGPGQVLIKVEVSGSNPKDWKIPLWLPAQNNTNTGDDIAGTIVSVGGAQSTSSNDTNYPFATATREFRAGDRVAAFHVMLQPSGSFAEYAIAPASTTFHIPDNTSFEEAATIPLAAMTSAVGLYCNLGLPEPWVGASSVLRKDAEGGVVVYGAASAVGAFAVKLLRHSNVHPIICVAGKGKDFVEGLIDREKGDTIVDYREGDEAVVKGIKESVKEGKTLKYAYDAVSEKGSYQNLFEVLDRNGSKITTVLPGKDYGEVPSGIELIVTSVGSVHNGPNREFGYTWFRLFGIGLSEGWFKPHPHEVMKGGLAGVQEGLTKLMEGKVSASKCVFRVGETQGAGQSKI